MRRSARRALGLAAGWIAGIAGTAAAGIRVAPTAIDVGGLAIVRTDAPAAHGTIAGAPLRFFPVEGGSAAIIGIDLDRAPGTLPIRVELRGGGAEWAELEVRARQFPEERLTVPKTYVEPDPATLRRIAREQKRLAALWTRIGAAPLWNGAFAAPTEGPAGSPFGLRRFFNGEPRSPHAGIDFKAPEGAPVHAANRGRVVLAENLFFTGNTVVVDHGLGVFTVYVHLSRLGVRPGALVDKGQEIGKVGMTGRATGPHLHFAVRVGEARIDPAALLGIDPSAGSRGDAR